MKNTLPKKLFLIITITFLCSHVFAQGPADPGDDPMMSSNNSINSANIRIPLQTLENQKAPVVQTSQSSSLKKELAVNSSKKHPENTTTVSFVKNEENEKTLQLILELASLTLSQI